MIINSKKIVNATKWSVITEICAKLITPTINIILVRLLTPEAFGAVATITMVTSFAEIFMDAGFQKYIIQHEFKNENELNRSTNVAFWTNFIISFALVIIIFVYRDLIAEMVGSPNLGNSISIASTLVLISSFSSIQIARYKRDMDFKSLFYARIITSVIPIFVTVPLAYVLKNYWSLLIGNIVSQLLNAIVLSVNSKWKPSLEYSFLLLKKMFSFSAWTLLESISIWLTNNIGVFIIGNYLNEYYLGIYKTSMATVNSYMGLITSATTPVLFSSLSRYQNNNVKFEKTYYVFQRLVAAIVFPMGAGIFLYRELVTRILLGNQWMEASGFVGIWGLMSSFTIVFSHFSSEVYRSKGNPQISLFSQLLHLIFLVPVLIIFVKYDFKVLYIARSLIRIQGILTSIIIMRLLYKFRISKTFKNLLPMFVSTIVMGAVGYGALQISGNILWQIITIMLCIVVYFVVLFVCFSSIRNEVREICIKVRKSNI